MYKALRQLGKEIGKNHDLENPFDALWFVDVETVNLVNEHIVAEIYFITGVKEGMAR